MSLHLTSSKNSNQRNARRFTRLGKKQLRTIVVFHEGLNKAPTVYPAGNGSDEEDEAMRMAILQRWQDGAGA